jgi:hypothetical protein
VRRGRSRVGRKFFTPGDRTPQSIATINTARGQGLSIHVTGLRDLESIILERKLRHGDHPELKFCASNCVVERDAAGNRKLGKRRSTGRIDGMIALTMALGVAPLRTATKFGGGADRLGRVLINALRLL